MSQSKHRDRIKRELLQAGLSWLSVIRAEGRYLPHIIYEDEHIGGAIYGVGNSGWCILVATEKRVIFLDKKPFFTTKDILTYDIVSGVLSNSVWLFSSVTLQTRGGEYALKYVNHEAASKFAKYIESRRLNTGQYDQRSGRFMYEFDDQAYLQDIPNQEAYDYIAEHDVGFLASTDANGQPHGTVVHYYLENDGKIYILTKSASKKARNLMENNRAAMTIHETGSLKTVQIDVRTKVETNPDVQERVFKFVVQEKNYKEGRKAPPVTSLKDGYYMVFRLTPTAIVFSNYAKK
jgi:general stress protein 26